MGVFAKVVAENPTGRQVSFSHRGGPNRKGEKRWEGNNHTPTLEDWNVSEVTAKGEGNRGKKTKKQFLGRKGKKKKRENTKVRLEGNRA